MRSKQYILSLLYLFLALFAGAQDSGFNAYYLSVDSNRLQGKILGRIYYLNTTTNNNFLFPGEWAEGELELSDGDKYEDMKLRYHIKLDELLAYNNTNRNLYCVEKEQVKCFWLRIDGEGHKFVKANVKGDDRSSQYFEELYTGTQSLLAHRFIDERNVNPYFDKNGIMRDTEYMVRIVYYRYSEREGYQKILVSRRAFYQAYPENKKEIRKVFRKHKIALSGGEKLAYTFELLDEQGLLY